MTASAAFAWALALAVAGNLRAADAGQPLPVLRTAREVRGLSAEQAAKHYPVRLHGVVTFFDQGQFFRFVQDETAGIYFYLDAMTNEPPLTAGQLIELEGETSPGEYAPIVTPRKIQVSGTGMFPGAKRATFEQVASGQEDSQFVEVEGIVRSARRDEQTKYYHVEIAAGGGRLTALASQLPVAKIEELVDSTVRIRGVCVSRFNQQRQLFDFRLLVPRPEDLQVETPAPADPFAIAPQPVARLLQFTPQGPYGHRVKVKGKVIYRQDDDTLYLEDESEGLFVETKQSGRLLPGDEVEVLGFPAKGEYTPKLQDAVFRKTGQGTLPAPAKITTDEALRGLYDCRLVTLEATVLDRARHSREQFVVLESGGYIFHAYLQRKSGGTDFAYLENGSRVKVTGVCLIETGNDWHAGADWRAKSFRMLLRSAGDIFVLQRPPWWSLKRLLWAVGVLALVALASFAWVAVLRRRVQKQTRIIRQKLEAEAAMKERYENLFENANDMVFTLDPGGRVTSINQAGEQWLQRGRAEILAHPLLDFVAKEERAAAAQWLEQVARGAESPAAEWNFVNAAGQRLRLEISARLVGPPGRGVEVEGIARDITERKRLENEILEISNREQRRIGHDLHDGVCQQLAGIAYRLDILADQLRENGAGESSEAERIGGLISEALNQTRGVARGLFPVKLEEEGLVSALEELAANASDLFNVRCRFYCAEPPETIESGVMLHLYYIAQEAVVNAARHGKATVVVISLTRSRERCVLKVQDNGTGFERPAPARTGSGMGIRIMRYRARVIGATLDLQSKPGEGTEVSCGFYPGTREARATLAHEQSNSR